MLIDFCLPAYNEEKLLKKNILKLLHYCQKQKFNFDWRIMIIINGSVDSSLNIANELNNKYPIKIKFTNLKKSGKGRAIKIYGLKTNADILIYMDIDLAVALHNIPDLIKPILRNQADLVIGSRMLPDSKIKRSFIRELNSQGYNFLSRLIIGHHFSDMQCGFKAIRAEVFKKIAPHVLDNKWFFDTELIAFASRLGYRVKEIPVDWHENRYDQRKSKVNLLKDSLKFTVNLVRLKKRLLKINKNL